MNSELEKETEEMEEELENIEETIDNMETDDLEEDEEENPNNKKKFIIGGIVGGVILIGLIIALAVKGNNGPYTIKFDTDGGSKIESQKVNKGDTVKEPNEPTKLGNSFLGWYDGKEKYDFNKKVKSNLTLKAKWENNNTADTEGIELDQNEVALLPGDTIPLIASVLPSDARDQSVKWESSDPEKVSVDEYGNIKAIAIGSATITATTNEGGFSAKCKVVVSNSVIKVTGLEVNEESIEVASGKTERIKASIEPSNATNNGLIWKSDDEKIATVSSTGLVTGIKKGSTTITVTTKDGGFEKRIEVSVDEMTLKNISLQDELNIQIGKSETLDVTFNPIDYPDKEVTWKSDDEKIATVDKNGKVSAKKEGKTTITVTTKDGKKKATCKVIVSEKPEINVKLDKTELTIDGAKTEYLSATITPSDDSVKGIAWSSSDKNVVTVDNGKVTAVGDGTATITVTSVVDRSKSATCKVTVTGLSKNYTYTVEEKVEEKPAENEGEEPKKEFKYLIKVYENGKDITSSVSSIKGIILESAGSTIKISKEEQEKLSSTIEMTIGGQNINVSKK